MISVVIPLMRGNNLRRQAEMDVVSGKMRRKTGRFVFPEFAEHFSRETLPADGRIGLPGEAQNGSAVVQKDFRFRDTALCFGGENEKKGVILGFGRPHLIADYGAGVFQLQRAGPDHALPAGNGRALFQCGSVLHDGVFRIEVPAVASLKHAVAFAVHQERGVCFRLFEPLLKIRVIVAAAAAVYEEGASVAPEGRRIFPRVEVSVFSGAGGRVQNGEEAFALPEEQMGLGHAFEMTPDLENGFLYELAQAQMIREIFPNAPLKYMPPTKFMTGNIFRGHIQDALFNEIAIWTGQGLQLLGMMTEAIHTPFMSDRYLSIENAKYIFNNMKNIGDDLEFKKDGIMQTRAKQVLDDAIELLEKMTEEGLFTALEKGIFADVKRPRNGGKGLDGVFEKGEHYYNPFIELMKGKGGQR